MSSSVFAPRHADILCVTNFSPYTAIVNMCTVRAPKRWRTLYSNNRPRLTLSSLCSAFFTNHQWCLRSVWGPQRCLCPRISNLSPSVDKVAKLSLFLLKSDTIFLDCNWVLTLVCAPRCTFLNLISAVWLLFISSAVSSINLMMVLVQGAGVQSLVHKVYSGGLSTHPWGTPVLSVRTERSDPVWRTVANQ